MQQTNNVFKFFQRCELAAILSLVIVLPCIIITYAFNIIMNQIINKVKLLNNGYRMGQWESCAMRTTQYWWQRTRTIFSDSCI